MMKKAAVALAALLLLAAGPRGELAGSSPGSRHQIPGAQRPSSIPDSIPTRTIAPPRPEDFPDILSMAGRPARVDDWPAARFADPGAWFGYTLPPDLDDSVRGGFLGPFLMNDGAWAGLTLAQLQLEDDSGLSLSNGRPEDFKARVFPGRLHQELRTGGFTVALDLVFVSGRSAIVRATVTNSGKYPRRVGIGWRGAGIEGGGVFTPTPREIRLETAKGTQISIVPMTAGSARPIVHPAGGGFQIRPAGLTLISPGESVYNYLAHSVFAPGETENEERAGMEALTRAPARAFIANERRWSGYLEPVLRLDPAFANVPGYRVAAVKALMTLLGNWRRPLAGLRHAGLVPSSGVRYFNGFWAWDSWKHAVALARFFPDLAQEQVRAMFDYQDQDGMVADCIYPDASQNNWLNTKPPLAAWAVWEVYLQTGDRSFLHELAPRLRRYHDWWNRRRDRDQDGLCEYGATADRLEAAKWESGMDNAVRFDRASLQKVDDRAWTLNLESVDLNAYLFAEKRYLADIMRALLQDDPSLGAESARLQSAIRAWMFDKATGYFYDAAADGSGQAVVPGAEGWIPLWAGVATAEQAAAVRTVLLDPRKFATRLPFPTLAADQPGFDPRGYWRGPVWFDQAYFAIQGLRRYGFGDDARRLTRQLLDGAEGLTEPGRPLRENYNPLTGEGLEAPDFSWTAAHVLLLLWGK